jgi:hypothetical protein
MAGQTSHSNPNQTVVEENRRMAIDEPLTVVQMAINGLKVRKVVI